MLESRTEHCRYERSNIPLGEGLMSKDDGLEAAVIKGALDLGYLSVVLDSWHSTSMS